MNVTLSVVIPVFNEAPNLAVLHAELARVLTDVAQDYEVLYIDDGSLDDSAAVLRQLQERDPHVGVVRFTRNYGQTAALAAGFDHAAGELIVTMDADRQNDPADIPALLTKLGDGYDMVTGWRVSRRDPWLTRRLPSMVANGLIGLITGVRLHDYGCTLKVLRRDMVAGLRLYGEMHRFIPALVSDLGGRVTEIPVHHRPRVAGTSKYGLSRTMRVLLDLIAVKFLTSYSTRPIQVFGAIGLLCSTTGLGITGVLGVERIFFGVELANRPIVWLGILLTLMGLQFITMGLLGELLVRTYHESQDKPVYRVAEVRGMAARGALTSTRRTAIA
jgi:glycosyltransferase involved in cell wall biosynthesis